MVVKVPSNPKDEAVLGMRGMARLWISVRVGSPVARKEYPHPSIADREIAKGKIIKEALQTLRKIDIRKLSAYLGYFFSQ